MNRVREIAKKLVAEMEGVAQECVPYEADHYRRLATIDYANALKMAPYRSPAINERAFEIAYEYAEKAISLGVPSERIETVFYNLRLYWTKKLLKEES